MNICLSIISWNRPYIHTTLSSLFASGYDGPVNIFCGSPDDSYLWFYKQHKKILIHPMPTDQWDLIKDWSPERRINYNWLRAMQPDYDNMVLEDDVIFHDDFFKKTLNYIALLQANKKEKYALSLFNREKIRFEQEIYQQTGGLVGQQCMFYTKNLINDLKFLVHHASITLKTQATNLDTGENWDAPGDCLVGKLLEQMDVPLFITSRSLVQHIGEKTSTYGKKTGIDPWSLSF